KNDVLKRSPVASPSAVYGVSGQRVTSLGPVSGVRPASDRVVTGPQPRILWDYRSESRFEGMPLLTRESVIVADTGGAFLILAKPNRYLRYRCQTDSPLSAPLGQHGESVYVASQDFNLYAWDVAAGRLLWRFSAGSPIFRKPEVNDEDIYVGIQRVGL